MRGTLIVSVVLASFIAVTAVSCGVAQCSPQNCAGCCSAGVCQSGGENAACGSNGNVCTNCADSSQICGNKVCVPLTGAGGGMGGGSMGGGAATGGGTAMGGGSATGGGTACMRTPVECSDQTIAGLDLKSTGSNGSILNASDGTGFRSTVNATGGGFMPTESYVYAKFTATGLQQLPALTDMTALDSMDWDIAFRRFIMRINSGDSGPGCVVAEVQPAGTFDTIAAVPPSFLGGPDDFLTRAPACAFIADNSGLTTSPRTALAEFYSYSGCVAMTDKPFVLATQTGKHVKLVITTYYATEAGQLSCNTSGSSGGALGGTVRVRWAFLD